MPPIYISKKGQQLGPYSLEELDQMLQDGMITGEDLYWHEGQSVWQPIALLPGYVPPPSTSSAEVSSKSPPPLPSSSRTSGKQDYFKNISSSSTYQALTSIAETAKRFSISTWIIIGCGWLLTAGLFGRCMSTSTRHEASNSLVGNPVFKDAKVADPTFVPDTVKITRLITVEVADGAVESKRSPIPVGSIVKLWVVQGEEVLVKYNGDYRHIPVSATDLLDQMVAAAGE